MKQTHRLATTLVLGVVLLLPSLSFALPTTCYCVLWLRTERGINIRGDAWTITPTHPLSQASEGDVLLTTEGPGHAAEIVSFEGQVFEGTYTRPAFIWVIEANYSRCKVGARKIPWNSPEIKGVYKAVR